MSFIDDLFDPNFVFDSDRRQRRDIQELKALASSGSTVSRVEVQTLQRKVDQLQLVTRALVTLLETKGLAQKDELEVLMQQIDLLDGVEDGRMSSEVWHDAPRCQHCQHFLNPSRERCIYCGRAATAEAGGPYRGGPSAPSGKPAQRMVRCGVCKAEVPQNETYFTDEGLLQCSGCFSG